MSIFIDVDKQDNPHYILAVIIHLMSKNICDDTVIAYLKEHENLIDRVKRVFMKSVRYRVYEELLGFFMHFVGRILFSMVEREKKEAIMEELANALLEVINIRKASIYNNNKSIEYLYDVLNTTEQVYSKCVFDSHFFNQIGYNVALKYNTTDMFLILHISSAVTTVIDRKFKDLIENLVK